MAESVMHFALKTVGLSRCGGRKPCSLLNAARHNLRQIQGELGAAGHIDPKRMADNVRMAGPATATEVQAMADTLLAAAGIVGLRRDHVQAIEVVFSLPPCAHGQMEYFSRCLNWLREALPLPVLLATAHRDEAAPHLHVLLLPLRDGRHIGGEPYKLASLKPLRESFFQKVAGPAGLKRDGARVRGNVKQWAIEAVLRECDAMGLPSENGLLWPVLVAAIKRDPTEAMQLLGIDMNSIRPTVDASPEAAPTNPYGLSTNPYGLSKTSQEKQSPSCVGLHSQTTLTPATKAASATPDDPASTQPEAISSLAELWAAVGCRSVWTKPTDAERERLHLRAEDNKTERMRRARDAQQRAIDRHRTKPASLAPAGAVHVDHDGLIRERDEHAHDLAAWAD